MSAPGIPVDVDVLRDEIQKTYTEVSTDQEQQFMFPTGRAWAQDLRYPEPELSGVPDASAESFAGVANPFALGKLERDATVLDLGCGAGTDLLVAAQMVGPEGRVIGVDMTPAMLDRARESAAAMDLANVELHESLIDSLPVEDASVAGGAAALPAEARAAWDPTASDRRPSSAGACSGSAETPASVRYRGPGCPSGNRTGASGATARTFNSRMRPRAA
jgi:arsenite methyltransferase